LLRFARNDGCTRQSALCSTQACRIFWDALRSLIVRGFARGKMDIALLAVSLFGRRGPFLRPGLRPGLRFERVERSGGQDWPQATAGGGAQRS
jgi:hypothetical protein